MTRERKYAGYMPCGKPVIFYGAATAIITPFDPDGKIDFPAMGNIIEAQISAGISALVVCGTTGEASTLSPDEIIACVEYAVGKSAGRVGIIAGTGSNDTAAAVSLSREAAAAGADGVMAVTPYYNKGTTAGIIRHYYAIADKSDAPLIIYNVPPRTGVNISPETLKILAMHDNIVAIKEASGDAGAAVSMLARTRDRLTLYCGCDSITLPVIAAGGAGVISVVSNVFPHAIAALCRELADYNIEAARRLQYELTPVTEELFRTVNPVPVKTACASLGLCRESFRLPLTSSDRADRDKIIGAVKAYIAEHING